MAGDGVVKSQTQARIQPTVYVTQPAQATNNMLPKNVQACPVERHYYIAGNTCQMHFSRTMVDRMQPWGHQGVKCCHGRLSAAPSLYLIAVYFAAIQTKGAPLWFQMPTASAHSSEKL